MTTSRRDVYAIGFVLLMASLLIAAVIAYEAWHEPTPLGVVVDTTIIQIAPDEKVHISKVVVTCGIPDEELHIIDCIGEQTFTILNRVRVPYPFEGMLPFQPDIPLGR